MDEKRHWRFCLIHVAAACVLTAEEEGDTSPAT